jgi:hypothetical protein
MDKRITRFSSFKEMKTAQRDAWQKLPASERIRAVMDITTELYALKGLCPDVPRLQRTLVRLKRSRS